jgi:GNAT superfamily N-acetyltransferase
VTVVISYEIKNVANEADLDKTLAFGRAIFKDRLETIPSEFLKETWLARMVKSAEFMLYARHDDEVVGTVFGIVEDNNSITVGMVAADARYRHSGIASSLLKELEKRAAVKGHHFLVLGALEEAEGFYLKCGYVPHLFVQAKPPLTLEKLRSFNEKYEEAWTYDDGTDIRLCLATKGIDRELQHKYNQTFPECSTQTLFTKWV